MFCPVAWRSSPGPDRPILMEAMWSPPEPAIGFDWVFMRGSIPLTSWHHPLPGYTVTATLADDGALHVFRAVRDSDGLPVVIKMLEGALAMDSLRGGLEYEFAITRRIDSPYVIRVHSVERSGPRTALVMEDIGGVSLEEYVRENRLELAEVLAIGIQLADGLAAIHAAGVIHRDINPANIIYRPNDGLIQIIDFGIATEGGEDVVAVPGRRGIAGSLPYLSPEQTGRMNRPIDYRTDLYSFGATLQELLTGQPLFEASDPIEWLHAHVARRPQAPAEIDPEIPEIVSRIVMRLVEKNPDERYQSAESVGVDLWRCLDGLMRDGDVAPFPIAKSDPARHLRVSSHLIGREKEFERLRAAFERARQGSREFLLIEGPSGIGKSRLIAELEPTIVACGGILVTVRSDAVRAQQPYAGFAAIIREVVRQLLTRPDEELADVRKRILAAGGLHVAAVLDVIPELETIVGPQPAAVEVGPIEAERRFQQSLQSVLRAIATSNRPLVFVFDNLEGLDAATYRLATAILTDPRPSHALAVGMYNPHAVSAEHPLMETIETISAKGVEIERITLEPLSDDALAELLAGVLGGEAGAVAELASVIREKTGGNPFFVGEFLDALRAEGDLRWDVGHRGWNWDLDAIRSRSVTDNQIELMAGRFVRLSSGTQKVLGWAACLGERFELQRLVGASGLATDEVVAALREAVAAGVVIATEHAHQMLTAGVEALPSDSDGEIAFAHDQLHDATLATVPNRERIERHLQIGRYLRERYRAGETEAGGIFEIVAHLAVGTDHITDPDERRDVARMHRTAAERAAAATDFTTALGHVRAALKLLGPGAWSEHYPDVLELHLARAEYAYLIGSFEDSDRTIDIGIAHARDLIDRARFESLRIASYNARGRPRDAIRVAQPILAELGHIYPVRPTQLHVVVAIGKLMRWFKRADLDRMRELPLMRDRQHFMAMELGVQGGSAALLAEPMLLPLMLVKGLLVSYEHGIHPGTASNVAALAAFLAGPMKRPDLAKRIDELALALLDRPDIPSRRGRALHLSYGFTRHVYEPIGGTLEGLRRAFEVCLEEGEYEFAMHAAVVYTKVAIHSGMALNRVATEIAEFNAHNRSLRQEGSQLLIDLHRQTVMNLRGEVDNPVVLSGPYFDISNLPELQERSGDLARSRVVRMEVLMLSCYFRDYEEAIEAAGESRRLESPDINAYHLPFLLHEGLSLLGAAQSRQGRTRKRMIRRAMRAERQLEKLAKVCPANAANKVALLRAARESVAGDPLLAHDLFDEAAALARQQGFIHEEGLAFELCGRMHMAANRPTAGEPQLLRAIDCYRRWGAMALVNAIRADYPTLAADSVKPLRSGRTTAATSLDTGDLVNVDIGSLMKALRTIVGEPVHSRMVGAIVRTAIEFAGAEKGVLALRNSRNRLYVEAESRVGENAPRVLQSVPLSESTEVSQAVVNYVTRTGTSVVIHDAQQPAESIPGLHLEPYIRSRSVRSVLCLPLVAEAEMVGLIYLENNLASHAFTAERFGTLEIIGLAVAGRLELSRKAAVDGLTELYNHDYFQTMLRQEFTVARRRERSLSLILADIDHFKQFNDTWGHQAGDLVLKEVARVVRSACRATDIAARYGGEELAVILLETGEEGAEMAAERIRRDVEAIVVEHEGDALRVTMSLGVATLGEADGDKDALIRRADDALYRAKSGGRNRVVIG